MRLGRLELPRPKALEPKSSASANSATGACPEIYDTRAQFSQALTIKQLLNSYC